MATDDISNGLRTLHLIVKSPLIGWHIWKETEPELVWFFERQFRATKTSLRLGHEASTYVIETIVPNDQAGRIEKGVKDNVLASDLDMIHGLDPIMANKRDAKVQKVVTGPGPIQPQPFQLDTISELEQKLIELEVKERSRSIDLKNIMDKLLAFKVELSKRLDGIEKKVDSSLGTLEKRCAAIESSLKKK